MKKLSKVMAMLFTVAMLVGVFATAISAIVPTDVNIVGSHTYEGETMDVTKHYSQGNSIALPDGSAVIASQLKTAEDGNTYISMVTPAGSKGVNGNGTNWYVNMMGDAGSSNAATQVADKSYYTIDFDFSTDSTYPMLLRNGTYAGIEFSLNARGFGSGKEGPCGVGLMFLVQLEDGRAVLCSSNDRSAPGTIYAYLGGTYEWNHMTYVIKIDKTATESSTIAIYLNGEFLLETSPWNYNFKDSETAKAYLYALRFNFLWGGTVSEIVADSSLNFDNVKAVTYPGTYTGNLDTLFGGETHVDVKDVSDSVFASEIDTWNIGEATKYAAHIGTTGYNTVEKAIDAWETGDTILLDRNAAGVSVSKPCAIDVGTYTFDYSIPVGVALNKTVEGTVSTFAEPDEFDQVIVYWHSDRTDTDKTEQTNFALGQDIVYGGTTLEKQYLSGGKLFTFVGWSEDQAATVATPLTPKEEAMEIEYYPIYQESEAFSMVIDSDGNTVYTTSYAEFVSSFASASAGSTIKFVRNMEMFDTVYPVTSLNIDLNGFTWYGNATNNGTGGKISLLRSKTANTVFNFYSSQPGGVLVCKSNAGAVGDARNGGCVAYWDAANVTFNFGKFGEIPGDNLSVYASCIVDGNVTKSNANIDGGSYYCAVNDYSGFIILRNTNSTVTVKNALLAATDKKNVNFNILKTSGAISFDNCRIINNNGGGNLVPTGKSSYGTYTFNNCELYAGIGGNDNTVVTLAGNTYFISVEGLKASIPSGTNVKWNVEKSITLSYPDLAIGTNSETGVKEVNYKKINDYPITYVCTNAVATDDQITSVVWQDSATDPTVEDYKIGGTAIYDKEYIQSLENGFYDLAPTWTAAEGDSFENLSNAPMHIFTPNMNITVANVTGLKYNLSLYSNFGINLYIPKSDYITGLAVSSTGDNLITTGEAQVVTIGGKDYYMITRMVDANKVASSASFYVTVTVDGSSDTQTVKPVITDYAKQILDDTETTKFDKELVMDMLAYAQAAYTKLGSANKTITAILSDEVYSTYLSTAATLPASTADYSALSAAIESAQLSLDAAPAFVFNVKDTFNGTVKVSYVNKAGEAVDISVDFVNGMSVVAEGGTSVSSVTVNTMRVYEIFNTLTITVTGDVNATGTYDFAAYANGTATEGVMAAYVQELCTYATFAKMYVR